ncbi:hypothetical protein ACWDYH_00320 [Nocardia goodfellowii]
MSLENTSYYGWCVTKVYDNDDTDWIGTTGPSTVGDAVHAQVLRKLEGKPVTKGYEAFYWTAKYEEGERVASGYLVVESTAFAAANDEEAIYSPLGDFAKPNWGATDLTYQSKPEWSIG